jgi:hypothetical protein
LRKETVMVRLSVLLGFTALVASVPGSAAAYLGTDTAGEYAYSDSQHPEDPDSPVYVFESIAATGTAGPAGDDNTARASLGFEFEFYGTRYSEVVVSTNGFISFDTGAGSGCCSGPEIPDATGINNFVALIWTDLTVSGNLYYQTLGSAPSRRFVVEYNGVRYLSSGGSITAQIVLVEGADEIQLYIQNDGDGTRTSTTGIENATGTDGIEIFYGNTSTIDLNNTAIVFYPLRDAPRLSMVTESPSVLEGGTTEIEVTATDRQGDPVTITWDTDLDGDFDDEEGETVTVSAEGLDGPTTVSIGVRAADPAGNQDTRILDIPVLNAPPVFTNLPEDTSILIGEEWTYTPELEDPGGDEITVEVGDRPAGMVLLPGGGVRWTPTADDVGDWTLTYYAYDDDDDPEVVGDGDVTQVITITVSENQPPGVPRIVSPTRNEEVPTARPTLVVETPSDPEGDALTISFEVAESDTYSDPIASGPQTAGVDGTTSWTVPVDMEDGQLYHWRVWAHDGQVRGPAASSLFRVVLGGDGGPDAGPDDGGPDDGGPDIEDAAAGCACQAGGSGGGSAGLLAFLLGLAGVLIRFGR